MKKPVTILTLLVLATLLVLIRMFEETLFYNPLLYFFKTNHSTQPLPEFDTYKLLANVSLRFLLNTLLSLAILWTVFKEKEVVKLSAILYAFLFVVLIAIFTFLLFNSEAGEHLTLFYVRRFLIQPLFLLILLPAFYFQKKNK
ncbi:exosortase F-associated protein [Ulvibacter sp. MAR_2010_11]|uniref:exosortase F system-associated membrane protein n=1 Tax=Ulvibacter sp. MAR_2010_11 TaxID=1250229 RepID=UPI000C2C6CF6|nr:exosortase F system-associated protein [Ulvibacter sp. MAR_2010_11]PKA82493.1 exosortase F-associated protein [Ulvibacter sp. MAR_2010_11]